ncbi:MAG: response regulator [Alphaproteobacteria bacterium]|jgi:DNA-binding response OmpR family regulator|nr:response regulator [Alphaproteobacteria bacterium]MDP7222422.1 response regulator [Alphaproteobacteria bacterium]
MSEDTPQQDDHVPALDQKQLYSLRSFRVLLVEDYGFMADLVSSMLREMGVGFVKTVSSAKEAQILLTQYNADSVPRDHFDIVITDWLLPEISGATLISWIRDHKLDSIKFMPIILCSAYTSEEVVVEGRDKGANEVMVKPVSAEKLSKRMLYVIDNPRPFIKAPSFFGPDRRRQDKTFPGEDRRKIQAEEIETNYEQDEKET